MVRGWEDIVRKTIERKIRGEITKLGYDYAELGRVLKSIIADAFERYSEEGKLSYDEMMKYNRMGKLKSEILGKTNTEIKKITKTIKKEAENQYKGSYAMAGKLILQEAGSSINIRTIPLPDRVKQVIDLPVSGLTLTDRLEGHRANIVLKINEVLTDGIYKGDAYRDMAKDLMGTLENDYVKATRIVRTEGHRVYQMGLGDGAKELEKKGFVIMKWWDAAEDDRTRESHVFMADKYSEDNAIPLDEDFVNDMTGGIGPYPGSMGTAEDDINCRCRLRTFVVVPDENEDKQ